LTRFAYRFLQDICDLNAFQQLFDLDVFAALLALRVIFRPLCHVLFQSAIGESIPKTFHNASGEKAGTRVGG
jgi:hypothetical protein